MKENLLLLVKIVTFVLCLACTHAAENCTTKRKACQKSIHVSYWNIPPYIKAPTTAGLSPTGIFPNILSKLLQECCGKCAQIEYKKIVNNSEDLKAELSGNSTMIAMPIYGSMTDVKYHNKPYFPLVESPGVIYIQKVQESGNAAKAVMEAVLQGWPVLVLTLIMAALSGIVMWALDSYWNPDQFPNSFFKGAWEGFWWAFVSMTTVGYGDRAPRSFIARVFAFFWVLVGLVIISIFTATVTTSLTALSLSNDVSIYGATIAALSNTEEQRYGIKNNAKVKEYASVKNFQEAILVPKDKVVGGLIDSYVAGAHKDLLSQAKGLKVATVFDHQFAYGFAIANALNDNDVERCLRRQLSTMESEITRTIQEMMEALPDSSKSAAEEKSSSLFDPNSEIFQAAVFSCLGMIAFFTIVGVAWEYFYYRPRQPKEAKTLVERPLSPHTTFEELVAAQAQELEDAMITEVMAFYKTWSKKLEEIKQKSLRGCDLDDAKTDIKM
ncbi:uncharacterized protein LOC135681732 [Rhopilema esculentum]|uniref:uncharacterized protein LOC135681732 n=1 Tax=Rhopilema esculentum TaxID=499914 RepID=UPI0031CDC148|eukprot:gene13340-4188_t